MQIFPNSFPFFFGHEQCVVWVFMCDSKALQQGESKETIMGLEPPLRLINPEFVPSHTLHKEKTQTIFEREHPTSLYIISHFESNSLTESYDLFVISSSLYLYC